METIQDQESGNGSPRSNVLQLRESVSDNKNKKSLYDPNARQQLQFMEMRSQIQRAQAEEMI